LAAGRSACSHTCIIQHIASLYPGQSSSVLATSVSSVSPSVCHAHGSQELVGAVGEAMDKDTVLYEACDVLVPAAIGNVIKSENAHKLNCQYVVEAANGPTTPNVGPCSP